MARRGWMKGLKGSQPAPRIVRPQLPAPALRTVGGEATTEEAKSDSLGESEIPNSPEASIPEASAESAQEPVATPGEPVATLGDPSGQVAAQGVDQGSDQPVLDLDMAAPTPAGFNGDIQL